MPGIPRLVWTSAKFKIGRLISSSQFHAVFDFQSLGISREKDLMLQKSSWEAIPRFPTDATNSASYLLPHLQLNMSILDVGCAPGSITVDLARKFSLAYAVGVEYVSDPLDGARALADSAEVTNITSS